MRDCSAPLPIIVTQASTEQQRRSTEQKKIRKRGRSHGGRRRGVLALHAKLMLGGDGISVVFRLVRCLALLHSPPLPRRSPPLLPFPLSLLEHTHFFFVLLFRCVISLSATAALPFPRFSAPPPSLFSFISQLHLLRFLFFSFYLLVLVRCE